LRVKFRIRGEIIIFNTQRVKYAFIIQNTRCRFRVTCGLIPSPIGYQFPMTTSEASYDRRTANFMELKGP